MSFPLIRNSRLHTAFLIGSSALVLASACGGGGSKKKESLTPPLLEIVAFENADGQRFAPGDAINVACDRRLTIHLGPSENIEHLLDNWEFRPPGLCGTQDKEQCGSVRLTLSYEDGVTELVHRASLAIVLEEELVRPELVEVTAQLLEGGQGEPFLVEGKEVSASSDLDLSFQNCTPEAMGGAGGAGFAAGGEGNAESPEGGSHFGGAGQP